MSLVNWEPFNGFDRFFDDRSLSVFSRLNWDLAVDVYKENGNIVAKMIVPEVDIKDIEVTFDDNILTIVGKREENTEIDEKNYYSKEIRRGSFARSVRLPKSVDAKNAEAVYENGVLSVSAPVVVGTEDKVVKIEIKNQAQI